VPVCALVEKGADVDAKDKEGHQVIQIAREVAASNESSYYYWKGAGNPRTLAALTDAMRDLIRNTSDLQSVIEW